MSSSCSIEYCGPYLFYQYTLIVYLFILDCDSCLCVFFSQQCHCSSEFIFGDGLYQGDPGTCNFPPELSILGVCPFTAVAVHS